MFHPKRNTSLMRTLLCNCIAFKNLRHVSINHHEALNNAMRNVLKEGKWVKIITNNTRLSVIHPINCL